MSKNYEIDMCEGAILKKLLAFAIPLMFSGILQLLFNAADIIVVGRFAGDNSLAAVGSNTSLINLTTNLFMGLSVGSNVLAARYFGSNEMGELRKTVNTSMVISVIGGLVITVIGLVFAEQLLALMQTPENIIKLSAVYLRIYFAGMPALMIYNFGSALLRAAGDTKRPLYYLMIAGIVNVLLNLLFVIVFKMDVAGVALATVISECISAFLVVRCLVHEDGGIKLVLCEIKFDMDKFKNILIIGLPAGFQGMLFSLSNVIIQSSVNLFGETIVAGNTAAANIEGFIYVAMNSFHQAAISFTGRNMGAKKYSRINKILVYSLICVIVTGLVLGWTAMLFGRQLLSIYSSSAEVIEAGLVRMKYIVTVYALCGMMDVMVGSIRGIGYSVIPMVVSLIGACGLRILWIATVFGIERFHTIETIYLSYPITWIITTLAHIVCFLIVRKRFGKEDMPLDAYNYQSENL